MAKEAEKILSSKLHYHVVDFDNFNFPKKSFSLANASFALPFNSPTTLIRVLKNIKNSIEDDGILCGQLFGVNDEWNTRSNMTFYTLKEVEKLFNDMELIYLKEEEKDGTIADGTPKHWHIFHFIARKK